MRIRLSVAVLGASLLTALSAGAQPSEEEAIDRTIACREIADDLERLACLDKAADTLAVTRIIREEKVAEEKREEREDFGLAGADREDDEEAVAAPVVADTPDDFGSEAIPEVRRDREEKRLKSITAKVAEIRINPYNKVTLTLDNGQVWRQLSSDNKSLGVPSDGKLYTARIKRSLMGNYMLTIEELKRTIRVRRVE